MDYEHSAGPTLLSDSSDTKLIQVEDNVIMPSVIDAGNFNPYRTAMPLCSSN
jgi:hypothetical protein